MWPPCSPKMRSTPRCSRKRAIHAAQLSGAAARSTGAVALMNFSLPAELCTQVAMQDLPRRGARHLGVADERHRARALVAGDAVATPVDDLRLARVAAVVQHEDRMYALAPFGVGQADHRDLLDLVVRPEKVLDLGWIDVLATRDDHVALAVDQEIVAVGIAAGHVAHRAPAVAKRLGGLLRH